MQAADAVSPPSINLSESSGSSVLPQIALEPGTDNVYITWQDNTPGNNDIFVAVSNDGGATFGTPVNVSGNAGSSTSPQIATLGQDTVYVTWQDNTPGNNDIFVAVSNDGGATFGTPVNVSGNAGSSSTPVLSVVMAEDINTSTNNVTLAWRDDSPGNEDIFISTSSDGGATFGTPVNVSNSGGASSKPQIASGSLGSVYLVWEENVLLESQLDIFISTSSDGGATFGTPVNVSNTPLGASSDARVAISTTNGDSVVVSWQDSTVGISEISLAASTDGGATFGSVNVSNTPLGTSINSRLALDEEDSIHVAWQDIPLDNNEILLAASTDGGATFGSSTNLSDNSGSSSNPQLALSKQDGGVSTTFRYVVWQDNTPGNNEIFFWTDFVSSTAPAIITIDSVSDPSPKWGALVQISGSVTNGQSGDTVTIDWGDGSAQTESIAISGTSWGPVSHVYDSSSISTNPNQLTATLVASDGTTVRASSSAIEINVSKHATAITLEPVSSVIQATAVTVNGTLTDLDASGAGIGGRTITFLAMGPTGLEPVLTNDGGSNSDGSFSVSGVAPSADGIGWTIKASFDGTNDSLYESSESQVRTFDTLIEDTFVEFDVPAGTDVFVNMTGFFDFDSSILFENVTQSGKVFVSQCLEGSPASTRYLALSPTDRCLSISPGAFETQAGSDARVTISYAGTELPDDYSEEEIDIFHEKVQIDAQSVNSSKQIVDVTSFRNATGQTVTGTTNTGLSRFIAAIALHEEKPVGSYRQQVLLGDENVVSLRESILQDATNSSASVTASFDKSAYTISDIPVLTIVDSNGNLDSSEVEIIRAAVMSETSDPLSIVISLTENGIDTGVFMGSFSFSTTGSSDLTDILQASAGDELSVSYISGAGFRASIDGVIEAGLVEMRDDVVDPSACFTPVGGAIELKLVNARLDDSEENSVSRLTIEMSYANAVFLPQYSDSINLLKLFYKAESESPTWFMADNVQVNQTTKSVVGEVGGPGSFSLGFDTGCGGGAGGGISRPGTGIVLDFVAGIIAQQQSGGGGGGRSSALTLPLSSSSPQQSATLEVNSTGEQIVIFMPVQNDGSVATATGGGGGTGNTIDESDARIEIVFVQVTRAGNFVIRQMNTNELPKEAFYIDYSMISSSSTQAPSSQFSPSATGEETTSKIQVEGSIASILGDTYYDLEVVTPLAIEGGLRITIPYNESKLQDLTDKNQQQENGTSIPPSLNQSTTGPTAQSYPPPLFSPEYSESNLRLLHYNGTAWEDTTILLDTSSNTITGYMKTLSPVLIALVPDGTYGQIFHENNPLSRVRIVNTSIVTAADSQVSQEQTAEGYWHTFDGSNESTVTMTIGSHLKNLQRHDQELVFIVQTIDSQTGVAIALTSSSVFLERAQEMAVELKVSLALHEEKDDLISSAQLKTGRPSSFDVTIFIWDRTEDGVPIPLSKVHSNKVIVN